MKPTNQPASIEDNLLDVFVEKIQITGRQKYEEDPTIDGIVCWVKNHKDNLFINLIGRIQIESLCEKEDVSSMISFDEKNKATIHLYADYIEYQASTVNVSVRILTYFLLSHELGHIMSYKTTGSLGDNGQDKYCDMFALSDVKRYEKDALPALIQMIAK